MQGRKKLSGTTRKVEKMRWQHLEKIKIEDKDAIDDYIVKYQEVNNIDIHVKMKGYDVKGLKDRFMSNYGLGILVCKVSKAPNSMKRKLEKEEWEV